MIGLKLLLKEKFPEYWSYTVDTTKLDATNAKTSIPFDLYNVNDASIKVDWGDNTTSTYTKTDYSSNTALNNTSSTGLIHTYSSPGIYKITITSNDFPKIKLYNSSSMSTSTPIYYFRNTLIKVNTIFPKFTSNFSYAFFKCTSLTSIPSGLFDNNTDITNFGNCFYQCSSLESIPEGLFRYNNKVTYFNECFCHCTSLTNIPSNLFDNCVKVTTFLNCFRDCSSLESIPEGLFRYNNKVTTFSSCFMDCTSLKSVPNDLFNGCNSVTNFNYCFNGCTSIESIGNNVFYNCSSVTDFEGCFSKCSSITSIPSGLFDSCIAVTKFGRTYDYGETTNQGCFEGCKSLTSIPQDLFKYNTAVTSFKYCFRTCTSLNDFTLHIGSESVTLASTFVYNKSGTTRTVYVPQGSTTQTTFNNVASSLGLTIIGE